MEFLEVLVKRSMCREPEQRQIEKEKLESLVYAANRAPQPGNIPVREHIIVSDKKYVRMLRSVSPSFLANSTDVIVIITDLERAEETMGSQGLNYFRFLIQVQPQKT